MEEDIRYYCDQCGEEFEVGDHIIETDYHTIHEECEDDYIDMMKNSWQYKTFMKGD